jgi:hypothetical protein
VQAEFQAETNFDVISFEERILEADFVIGSATVFESNPCTP